MRRPEPDYAYALSEAERFLGRWRDRPTMRVREDLAQEAVMESWIRRRSLRDAGRFYACVRTIARRLRFQELQRRHRAMPLSLDTESRLSGRLTAPEPGPSPALPVEGEWVDVAWLRARLDLELARLDPFNQHLLREFYGGATLRELSERHGMSVARVKARLHRGRKRLRRELSARVRRARHEFPGAVDGRPRPFVSTEC